MNWRDFRKAEISQRRTMLRDYIEQETAGSQGGEIPQNLDAAFALSGPDSRTLSLGDLMTENAVGVFPVPLGLATGFLMDGEEFALPLATEEPSVIAAASYAATMIARNGGFETWASDPIMTAQIYIDGARTDADESIRASEPGIQAILKPLLASMEERGGGYRSMQVEWLPDHLALRVHVAIDVRDAMGANLLNTCAEALRPAMEKLSGGSVLMAILSNQAGSRLAGASFSVDFGELSRGAYRGLELARRVVKASQVAEADPARAVTNNKGIMNGISALALACGNDTRGIESALHSWASREGRYRSISTYWIEKDRIFGRLEAPLPFATVGGSTLYHPVAAMNLRLLRQPSAVRLSRIAAGLGLAQNFAALLALCGEGIQEGHMRLHERRKKSVPQAGES